MSGAWRDRHPLEKVVACSAWLMAAMLLPPWPWSVVVLAATSGVALFRARIRPAVWGAMLTAPASFSAMAVVPLWWNQGFAAWNASVYAAPLRSFAASSVLLLLGLTTPIDELLALGRMPACRRQ